MIRVYHNLIVPFANVALQPIAPIASRHDIWGMTPTWTDQAAPSLDDFDRLAKAAFEALPPLFRQAAGDVVIRVDDFADEETLRDMQIEDPFEQQGFIAGFILASVTA